MLTQNIFFTLTYLLGTIILWSVIRKVLIFLPPEVPKTFIRTTSRILLLILCGIMVVSTWVGKSPALLLSGIGASAGVALFALKDNVAAFIAGVKILIAQELVPGTHVEFKGAGVKGEIKEVTIAKLVLQADDGVIRIPIQKVANDIVIIKD